MAVSTPPLTLGEILDRTVQLYRRNFALFIGISLLPAALDILISGSFSIYFSSQLPALQAAGQAGKAVDLSAGTQPLVMFFLLMAGFVLVGLPLLCGTFAVAFSSLNFAAAHRNHGDAVTVRASFGYGFRLFWRHVGILLLQLLFAGVIPGAIFSVLFMVLAVVMAVVSRVGQNRAAAALLVLAIFVLFVAVAVVSVWVWLRYCLAYPASLGEGKKAWASMKRSAELSKGSRGRIFVMYLLMTVLTVIVYYGLTIPLMIVLKFTLYKTLAAGVMLTQPPLLLQVANLGISLMVRTFVMPIYAIALLLFYNDQRTRKEGYDIELLMAQAGWSELAVPVPVAEVTPAAAIEEAAPFPVELAAKGAVGSEVRGEVNSEISSEIRGEEPTAEDAEAPGA